MLARGAHPKAGAPHAEALAIDACGRAGRLDRIRTVVVTLEPCNHTGRTPPCTDAILRTPATAVWIGALDPNPNVSGGGAKRLQIAGLQVRRVADLDDARAAPLAAACADLIAPFAKRVLTGLPWVTVKQALDAAGRMIPPPGRKTFTSADSLTLAHRLRRRADAILTGSGTVLADAPDFTVRKVADVVGKQRRLIILDRRGRVEPPYLDAARARGFDVRVETDVIQALRRLGAEGALDVLVEAGPELLGSILASPWWDEHVLIRKGAAPDGSDLVTVRYRDRGSEVAS